MIVIRHNVFKQLKWVAQTNGEFSWNVTTVPFTSSHPDLLLFKFFTFSQNWDLLLKVFYSDGEFGVKTIVNTPNEHVNNACSSNERYVYVCL